MDFIIRTIHCGAWQHHLDSIMVSLWRWSRWIL